MKSWIRFEYIGSSDPHSTTIGAVNDHARVSFRYDNLGLPVEERCDVHLIERSYDKHDLVVSLRSTLGTLR